MNRPGLLITAPLATVKEKSIMSSIQSEETRLQRATQSRHTSYSPSHITTTKALLLVNTALLLHGAADPEPVDSNVSL